MAITGNGNASKEQVASMLKSLLNLKELPIIVEAAMKLGVSIPKSVMSLAYGDQITNMLQPFWALPLLGITGLKAKEILPYTLLLMLLGGVIFITGLLGNYCV